MNVPYLDAILFLLGVRRDDIDHHDLDATDVEPAR